MEQSYVQLLELAFRKHRELGDVLEKLRPLLAADTSKQATADIEDKLRALLHSDKWPVAVDPRRIADVNSDDDKMQRATSILDRVVDVQIDRRTRFLDYGCGEGHAAFVASDDAGASIGYDIRRQGWRQFPERANFLLTTDTIDVLEAGSYDVILLHDVLDHVDNPAETLHEVTGLLAPAGRINVYCHPWCSRHGGHNYHGINRAYAQLFFHEKAGVIRPLQEYREWFKAAGLEVLHERPTYGEVPRFFRIPHLAERIKSLYRSEDFPEEHLRIEGVIYSLSK